MWAHTKTAREQEKNPLHLQCSNNQFVLARWWVGGEKRRKHFRKWEKYLLCHYIGFASAKILASSSTSLLSSRNNAAGGWQTSVIGGGVLCFKFKLDSLLNEINLWGSAEVLSARECFSLLISLLLLVHCKLFKSRLDEGRERLSEDTKLQPLVIVIRYHCLNWSTFPGEQSGK